MPWRYRRARAEILALMLALFIASPPASSQVVSGRVGAPPHETPVLEPRSPAFFQRSDIAFVLASTAAVVVTGHNDLRLRQQAIASTSGFARHLASGAQPFGNPVFVVPGLLAGYGLARAFHAPGIAAGFTEVGLAVVVAGAGALALKEAVGRARPEQSPADPLVFHSFSGQNSFPSGHATLAFALAESINRTSGSRWAPWLTYPAATLVGWSRVRDNQHWGSDVVAGAALGVWTARKVHRMLPAKRRLLSRFGLGLCAPDGSPGLLVTLQ